MICNPSLGSQQAGTLGTIHSIERYVIKFDLLNYNGVAIQQIAIPRQWVKLPIYVAIMFFTKFSPTPCQWKW